MAEHTLQHQRAIVTWLDAKAAGLKRYFTGKPCPEKHFSERFTANRACIACAIAKQVRTRKEQPHLVRVKDAAYRARSIEKCRKNDAAYKKRHPLRIKASQRKSRQKHKAKIKKRFDAYRATHRELYRESTKRWIRKNPDKKKVLDSRRKARKRGAEGSFSAEDIKRIRKAQRDRCGACRRPLNGGGHADHIIALANGGSNWPSNIQLLCPPCNGKKRAKDPITFMQELGYLL